MDQHSMKINHKDFFDHMLSAVSDTFRGQLDAYEFKLLILPLLLYKYLSDLADLSPEQNEKNRFFLPKSHRWSQLQSKFEKQSLIEFVNVLNEAVREFEISYPELDGIFTDTLGLIDRLNQSHVHNILNLIGSIDFSNSYDQHTQYEIASNIFEWFAKNDGKKGGEYITPNGVAELVARVATQNCNELIDAYDPACGSAGLLLATNQQRFVIDRLYGQEINRTVMALAKIRVLLSGQRIELFVFNQGNSLESTAYPNKKFDVVLSVPPFCMEWKPEHSEYYGPKLSRSSAEFAFVWHGLQQLAEDGTMVMVLSYGTLFRVNEQKFRQYLIEELNCIEAVVALPPNLFFNTGIQTCMLVFRKQRQNPDNILFVDASNSFGKERWRNYLRDQDIQQLLDTLAKPKSRELYSEVISISKVTKEKFNLDVALYVVEYRKETIQDFIDFHRIIERFQASGKGKTIVFRGMADAKWQLIPSVGRLSLYSMWIEENEKKIFEQFKQQALPYLDFTPRNDWEWLALAQHHGLPTRLLDWTINPLIALYFAVEDESIKSDAIVYVYIDDATPIDINHKDFVDPLNIPTDKVSPCYIPAHLTSRIIAQSGLFTIHQQVSMPFASDSIHKIIIPKAQRSNLKHQLYRYGIHKGTVYPGLDGLSSHIKWFSCLNSP
jgi:type I restriction-modification system DNA methylase subunit